MAPVSKNKIIGWEGCCASKVIPSVQLWCFKPFARQNHWGLFKNGMLKMFTVHIGFLVTVSPDWKLEMGEMNKPFSTDRTAKQDKGTTSKWRQICNKISLEISVPIAFKVQRGDLYLHTPDVYNVS